MDLFPKDLPKRTLAEMAGEVLQWLDDHAELKINPTNRISKICQTVLNKKGQVSNPSDEGYAELVLSYKDLQELWAIVYILGDELHRPKFTGKLKLCLQDPLFPNESDASALGRNTQFELYLAAIATRAGCVISSMGENRPDWLVETVAFRWTIEAKRIRSWDQVQKRIEKGASQIAKSGIGGVIALDISAVCNPQYLPLDNYIPDQALEAAQKRRGEFLLNTGLRDRRRWTEGSPVGLLLVHDFIIQPAAKNLAGDERPWGLIAFWDQVHLVPEHSSAREKYEEFLRIFGPALPHFEEAVE